MKSPLDGLDALSSLVRSRTDDPHAPALEPAGKLGGGSAGKGTSPTQAKKFNALLAEAVENESLSAVAGKAAPGTSGKTPLATTGKTPLATTGKTPLAATGKTPPATTGKTLLATTGETPLATTGETPLATPLASNDEALSASSDEAAPAVGDNALEATPTKAGRAAPHGRALLAEQVSVAELADANSLAEEVPLKTTPKAPERDPRREASNVLPSGPNSFHSAISHAAKQSAREAPTGTMAALPANDVVDDAALPAASPEPTQVDEEDTASRDPRAELKVEDTTPIEEQRALSAPLAAVLENIVALVSRIVAPAPPVPDAFGTAPAASPATSTEPLTAPAAPPVARATTAEGLRASASGAPAEVASPTSTTAATVTTSQAALEPVLLQQGALVQQGALATAAGATSESASGKTSRAGEPSTDGPIAPLRGFSRGAFVGQALSAYGGRGHESTDQQSTRGRFREERESRPETSRTAEPNAAADLSALAQVQQPVLEATPSPIASPQPTAPMAPPQPIVDVPNVEFAARPPASQNENTSVSLHHPDLGPIRLDVQRMAGRIEVHAVIESVHAEAVLRANESGIRQSVQQSGLTFSALRVRVRGEENNALRQAQVRRRRANERET
ncbi:MAG: hypothetical protein RLZZ450_4794 [Pseudomonadota bacterium]|jgi:hypothetical protein